MPSDILGVSVYNQKSSEFDFKPGPIFANVVLADEINRTTPRTQSSLLEAMNEGQVSVDNVTHELSRPFFVVATQNPQEHFGTYPLPESQMDRFALRIAMGYPSAEEERQLVAEQKSWEPLEQLEPVSSPEEITELQDIVYEVTVEPALQSYMMEVVRATRGADRLALGISTRGAKSWFQAARAHALVDGRSYCVPDDFKETALAALALRVTLATYQDTLARTRTEAESILTDLLHEVSVPL
jgi:MoxR-like ATPase